MVRTVLSSRSGDGYIKPLSGGMLEHYSNIRLKRKKAALDRLHEAA